MMMPIKRGDIVVINLDPIIGAEQGKIRPALIIQNNIGNEFSPTTIIAPITSKIFSKQFPTNVQITKQESKLEKNSTILLNQIRTVDRSQITKKIDRVNEEIIKKVDLAIKVSLDIQ